MWQEITAAPWLVPTLLGVGCAALGLAALVLATPVYKHIICLRYLFAGWKAVVPLVSALPAALGVFLLILVFAIMDGFVRDTREMTRGTLSDIIVDAHLGGLPYYDEFAKRIEQLPGVEAATPIIQTYAIVRIKPRFAGIRPIVRPCMLIGIRPAEKAEMGRFQQYLERQKPGRADPAGFLAVPPEFRPPGAPPHAGCIAGAGLIGAPMNTEKVEMVEAGVGLKVLLWALAGAAAITTLFMRQAARRRPGRKGWRAAMILALIATAGLATGALATPITKEQVLRPEVTDVPLVDYGGDLVVSTIPVRASGALETETGGVPKVSSRALAVVDVFKSGYWEADSTHIYVDFNVAQQMAGMDGQAASGGEPAVPARASQIQVKVRDPAQAQALVGLVREAWQEFLAQRPETGLIQLTVNTWENQQKMILTVVEIERNITALMLGAMFLGFGVLIGLISYVMAYIKSRDVGVLKALGARDAGVGSLFLGYGFIIGLIGIILGLAGALLMIHYLDAIEIWVNQTLSIDIFPREMYYFEHIPRHVSAPWCMAVTGAVLALSTLASMAGGLLAALKQPVETLRYE